MLRDVELIAFVGSQDLAAADAFYGGVLGLELVESSSFSRAYDAAGTTLRVTLVESVTAAGYTVLGWNVPDIALSVDALAAAGVACTRYDGLDQDARGVWTAPGGTRVAWFLDPDGNVLSVSQAGGGGGPSEPP